MSKREVRLSGFGGQGIIMAGYLLGKAAAIYDRKNAVFTQSYGPESRGGSCAGELVISDEPIDYPRIVEPDIVVTLSQEAYAKYSKDIAEGGTLIIEEDHVRSESTERARTTLTVPATRLAEELGRRIAANVVMLGFLAATTEVVSAESLKQAIASTVPRGTESLNLRAFEKGWEHGLKALADH